MKYLDKSLKLIATNLVFIVLLIILLLNIVYAAPPLPEVVEGTIYNNDTSGAANGVPVEIYNNDTGQTFYTQVYAPIPSKAGAYSSAVVGSNGDLVIVTAYNDTVWGFNTGILDKKTTKIDVTLDTYRDAEANVTITFPDNNSLYNTSNIFNVTINMSVLGANGINCNVTLNISDESVIGFNTGSNTTNNLGAINLGEVKTTSFELIALTVGTVSVNATGVCQNSGTNFENLQSYAINLQTQDVNPPIINPMSPQNNTDNKSTNNIEIKFNVSDDSNINDCQLYINGSSNQTIPSPAKDTPLTFTPTLVNGVYNWYITCIDEYANLKQTGTYNLNVSVYYPIVSFTTMQQDIMLNAGTTTNIECNITVYDGNGASDIDTLTSVFYNEITTAQAPDDNNNHYTNNTCQNTAIGENQKNYTCIFPVEYYAINGTWNCSATATDLQNLNSTNETNTSIDPLYAINISAFVLDYGDVMAGSISNNKSLDMYNIGNQPMNISVRGYGGSNPVTGNNTAMLCGSGENISINDEKYSTNINDLFNQKINLSSIQQDISVTIPKQNSPGPAPSDTIYWQIKATIASITSCNGTIVFTAKQV